MLEECRETVVWAYAMPRSCDPRNCLVLSLSLSTVAWRSGRVPMVSWGWIASILMDSAAECIAGWMDGWLGRLIPYASSPALHLYSWSSWQQTFETLRLVTRKHHGRRCGEAERKVRPKRRKNTCQAPCWCF
jgi:hypothetical protein